MAGVGREEKAVWRLSSESGRRSGILMVNGQQEGGHTTVGIEILQRHVLA